ncbi:hypothetical protein C0989_007043 [Termitomyces sp. Mn162]|nr:hypothetical protein C0989_007043 [Termitomyces sp. Mn162]
MDTNEDDGGNLWADDDTDIDITDEAGVLLENDELFRDADSGVTTPRVDDAAGDENVRLDVRGNVVKLEDNGGPMEVEDRDECKIERVEDLEKDIEVAA